MGLRQAFGRWRGADDTASAEPGGAASDPTQSTEAGQLRDSHSEPHRDPRDRPATAAFRHQADPSTGELMRVPAHDEVGEPPTQRPAPASAAAPVAPAADTDFGPCTSYGPRPPVETPPLETPAASATPPVAGGLVVGRAELRQADVELPASYSSAPRPYDRNAVRHAWDLVGDRADKLVRNFYADLFLRLGNDAFQMFPASMAAQRQDFGKALIQWVVADDPELLSAHLAQLGADHRKFDVLPRHYDIAAQSLVSVWKAMLGPDWTPEIERAVVGSYTRLASTMIDGALAVRDEPATWGATVVGHERVLRDFAVLRLQADEPYLFRAGQYLTIEAESRPREWRRMSIASAPRPDNTLDLHVRSINATGVAASLVMHTRVGDRMRLGAPRGNNLVVEPGTLPPGGLLCLASGTGAAPMVAVVESLLAWPDCPPVHVFTGARTAADLYPAEQLARAVEQAGRVDQVQVYGVVSQDPGYTGLRGKIEDVVPTLKDWAQLGVDVLIAGPDSMIQTTIFGLVGRGVPESRIHFDQYDVSE